MTIRRVYINPSKRQTQRIRFKGVNEIKKKIYAVCPPPFEWTEDVNTVLKYCPLRGIKLNNGNMAYKVDYRICGDLDIYYGSEWYTFED